MGSLGYIVGTVLVLSVIWSSSHAQQQQPQPGACAQRFDGELSPTCFEPRGLTFQGVLLLITRNMSGELPAGETVASYRQKVCRIEELDFIIPCILRFKAQFTNTTCTQEEVNMIDQSGRQLLRMTEGMCTEPCEMNIEESLSSCFVSAQINPDPYLNTSMVVDKYPLLGNTTVEAQRFCQVRTQLFTCLKQVTDTCPSAIRTLDEMGFDVDAYRETAEILCREQTKYFEGFSCFYSGAHNMTTCMMGTGNAVGAVMFGRMRSGEVKPSEFAIRLCEVRVQKVACEMSIYQQPCSSHLDLRLMTECTLLPHVCQNHPSLQPILSRMCVAQTTPSPVTTRKPEVTTPRRPHVIPSEVEERSTGSSVTASGLMSVAMLIGAIMLL